MRAEIFRVNFAWARFKQDFQRFGMGFMKLLHNEHVKMKYGFAVLKYF